MSCALTLFLLDGYGGYGYNYGYSGWSGYGRWIVLGVVVGLAVLIYLLVCCCNRKRTRSGQKPVKYTGWATPYQHPQQSGVVPNDHGNNYAHQQPYVAPQMQQQQSYPQTETYPQTQNYGDNNYAAGGYQSTQPPITNAAGYDANNPPSYPYQQPTYPNNVAGREK